MSKYKKYVSSICSIFSLSIIILLVTGFQVHAENTYKNDTLPSPMIENKKQDQTMPEKAVKAAKNILFGEQKQNSSDDDESIEVEEEQDLMENALEILEVADNYWNNGDIENTLNELDKAYALLLDTNGNVEIARQKDDLRLLISRRILTVYSSQQTRTNGKGSEIPLLLNADVEKEIRSFQGPEREFFTSSYQRSGMYKEIIVGELRKAGVPEELFWLPLVESGFKASALSRARALGLWQFIPSTGYKFGLTRDEWTDERMDVLKSTQAAIAYLKELHSMFGDWLTVLAAYNCGEGRVLRVISRQHINYFDRFWDLYSQLPNETARYVPRFLATLHIIKNPGKYGFDLQTTTDSSLRYETVKVNKMMKLADVASKIEVSEDVINVLNAELRYKITPNREYELKIPKDSLQKFNLVYNDIPDAEKPTITRYIARSLSLAISNIAFGRVKQWHLLQKDIEYPDKQFLAQIVLIRKTRLVKGQIVRIPVDHVETANMKQKPSGSKNARKTASSVKIYKVKQGDSLLSIAQRFNVPVAKIKEINNLKTNSIQAGRKLKLPCDEVGNNENGKQEEGTNLSKSAG
ncbi:MAG: transglycosylase SLT domain-containing protein [Candidatus Moduliflexus flocculans]|nr:transglycosylase SLT domain-containing protein [Candidatus Moduliflexus flocculans]